jgi:hypothetical protein
MPKSGRALIAFIGVMAAIVTTQVASAADWDISRSHRVAIKELLQEMGTYDIITRSIEKGLVKAAKEDKKKAANMAKVAATLDEKKLDENLIPLYAYYYSKKDAKNITEFFRSETGQIAMKSARKKAVDGKKTKMNLTPDQEREVRKFFNSSSGRAFSRNNKFIKQELKYRIGIMTTRLMYEYIYPR